MRLRPAQIAVRLICGESIPHARSRFPTAVAERVEEGHAWLVRMTGKDFGYDLQAWHDYLKDSKDGGYTYGRNITLPRVMQKALESPKWQAAVQELLSGRT